MNKILSLIMISLVFIPSLAFAEKGDTEIRFNTKVCETVKYTCNLTQEAEQRYGWSYYTDDAGCGCIQTLSDKNISTITKKMKSLIVAIDTVFPEKEEKLRLLNRIKKHLNKNYRNSEIRTLYSDIILGSLYGVYGDF